MTNLVIPEPINEERIAQLQSRGIASDVARIDLEMVKMKMAEPEDGIGWNEAQLEDAEVEYKRYLMMCRKYPHPDYATVPNKIMDTMWHYHILDTRAYVKDSESLFGGYFHHYPYFGLRGDEDKQRLKDSFEQTKERYKDLFGEPMARDGDSSCWHDCQGRCWHACSN